MQTLTTASIRTTRTTLVALRRLKTLIILRTQHIPENAKILRNLRALRTPGVSKTLQSKEPVCSVLDASGCSQENEPPLATMISPYVAFREHHFRFQVEGVEARYIKLVIKEGWDDFTSVHSVLPLLSLSPTLFLSLSLSLLPYYQSSES